MTIHETFFSFFRNIDKRCCRGKPTYYYIRGNTGTEVRLRGRRFPVSKGYCLCNIGTVGRVQPGTGSGRAARSRFWLSQRTQLKQKLQNGKNNFKIIKNSLQFGKAYVTLDASCEKASVFPPYCFQGVALLSLARERGRSSG